MIGVVSGGENFRLVSLAAFAGANTNVICPARG